MDDPLVESKTAEAINAATIAEEARMNALKELHANIGDVVRNAVRAEMAPEKGRYIDVSRVPLICQAIVGINDKMGDMVTQDQFWPVKTLVYMFAGLMLLGVSLSLLLLVFPHLSGQL